MIGNCNINNLAQNQVSAIFLSRAIRRSVLPMLVPIRMGTKMAAGNLQKTLSLSFASKA